MNDAERLHAAGRRGNGLRADDYVRVARPTTALADLALDALRRTGIAARATESELPGRDELWADARELDDAATVLTVVLRHSGASAADLARVGEEVVLAELGDLVAPTDLDADADGDDRSGPLGTRNPTPSARPYPTPTRPQLPGSRDDVPLDPSLFDDDDLDDPDDHYRPEQPAAMPALSRTTVWALAILAVGVVALALAGLAPTVVGAYAPLTSLLGTAAVLVGVGMLVTRLRDGRRDDDDDRGGPNGDGAIL